MTRLGYQIPNFTYPGIGPEHLFEAVCRQAVEAEQSGFDTVLVMDHFYQLPMLGPAENYMLECYTLLAGLAGVTDTVRLSALVTGNTYRNPAVLAKTVATLDVISGGRSQLGIGAGWYELEHDAFGIEFGTFTDRFEKLEEALQIVVPMLRGERVSFTGKHYQTREAFASPAPLGPVPVLIGGGGEKKTLRLVAQYGDESNLICLPDELPRKLEALNGHCERLGRDRSEITVTYQRSVCIAETMEQAVAERTAYLASMGLDALSAEQAAMVEDRIVTGDPDTVAEKLSTSLIDGIDGFTINLPACAHIPGRVEMLGRAVAPLIG